MFSVEKFREFVKFNHLNDFIDFLSNTNFLNIALAFVISTNVQQITNSIVTNILNPLLRTILRLDTLTLKIGNIQFPLGNVLNSIVTFGFVLYFYFLLFKITQTTLPKPK